MTELTETDHDAIGDVVRILTEAGVDVQKTNHVQTDGEGGVTFKLHCRVQTRYARPMEQLSTIKGAAMNAPEIGMDGEEIEE